MTGKTLFISAVTDEFASLRRELVEAFDRPGLDTKSQDELYDSGEPRLLKLADYVRKSDAVVHIIGDMAGRVADAAAHARSRDALLERYPPGSTLSAAGTEPMSPRASALQQTMGHE